MFRLNVFLIISLLSISTFAKEGAKLSCVKGRFEILNIGGTNPWYNFFLTYDAQTKTAKLESNLMNPDPKEAFKSTINATLQAFESGARCPCIMLESSIQEEDVLVSAGGTMSEVWDVEHIRYMNRMARPSEVQETDCTQQNKTEWLKDQNRVIKNNYGY